MGAARRVPTRSCVACRTARPKRDLVRVVRAPDGVVGLDETGRVAGRGAYLCRDAACWARGLDKGAVQRALGTSLPPELRARLERGPERSAPAGDTETLMTTPATATMIEMTGGERRGEE